MIPQAAVFDLGGTLMDYQGMPLCWADFYPAAFGRVAEELNLTLTGPQLNSACRAMEAMNPRFSGRVKEISPEDIMRYATRSWQVSASPGRMLAAFFGGLQLSPCIYPDAIPALKRLRREGIRLAGLTDLPTAMPDALFRQHIAEILPLLDVYLSSAACGWRKPHPAGLLQIARRFGLDASQLIFVGDEQKDIKTARNAGCRAVLLDRNGAGADWGQEKTFGDLTQLADWIVG